MKINLWKPGEAKYNEIEVNIGDKIQLKTWNMEILGGVVQDINDKEITLEVEDIIYSFKDQYLHNEIYNFALENIYGIDVILSKKEIVAIENTIYSEKLEKIIAHFSDDFMFIQYPVLIYEEDMLKLINVYTKTLENKTYFDNIYIASNKNPIYVTLLKLNEKYRRKSYQIEIDTEEDEEIIKDKISHLGILKTIKKVEG